MSLTDLSKFQEKAVTMGPVKNEDELFLIRVPKGFDIKKLNGMKYSPPGTVQVEAKKGKRGIVSVLELGSYGEKTLDINLLTNSSNNKCIAGPCIKQSLCISKSVHLKPSSPSKPDLDLDCPGPVPLPSGLKERFTPFGTGHPVRMKHKKKKKKSKRMRSVDETEVEYQPHRKLVKNYSSFQEQENSSIMNASGIFVGSTCDLSLPSSKKPKKHKKRKSQPTNSPDTTQNESRVSSELDYTNGLSPSPGYHHQKKKHSWSEVDSQVFENSSDKLVPHSSDDGAPLDDSRNSSHKKKKKRKSEKDFDNDSSANFLPLNSINGPSGEIVNSSLVDTHEKKRKRKLSSGYHSLDNSIAATDSLLLVESDSMDRKFKKKKVKKEIE